MSYTTEIERVIIDYIQANGAAWLALMGDHFYHIDEIPDCAPASATAYGAFGWVGEKDIRTLSELRDQHWIQFVFYGGDRHDVDEIRDGCFCLLDASFYDLKTMEYGIRLRKDKGAPGFKAMKSDRTDRFSKYWAMAQFRLDTQKKIELIT